MNLLLISSFLLLLSAILVIMAAKKQVYNKNSDNFKPALHDYSLQNTSFTTRLEELYRMHGFNVNTSQAIFISALFILSFSIVFVLYGVFYTLLLLMLLYILFKIYEVKSKGSIKTQFLFFLEEFSRELSSGFNLEYAFRRVSNRMRDPLKQVMARVLARRDLGIDLNIALASEASIIKFDEMKLLSTLLRVNQRYGGRLTESLTNLTSMLRQQDKSKRELSAMTGETRVTAVVLCIMPLVIGGYMIYTNPAFSEVMFSTTQGQFSLMLALMLQCLGTVLIWRMLRSV